MTDFLLFYYFYIFYTEIRKTSFLRFFFPLFCLRLQDLSTTASTDRPVTSTSAIEIPVSRLNNNSPPSWLLRNRRNSRNYFEDSIIESRKRRRRAEKRSNSEKGERELAGFYTSIEEGCAFAKSDLELSSFFNPITSQQLPTLLPGGKQIKVASTTSTTFLPTTPPPTLIKPETPSPVVATFSLKEIKREDTQEEVVITSLQLLSNPSLCSQFC